MKQYKELFNQTIIYGLGTIIPRVLNFLLTPLYTYLLIEQDFGIITEMYSYVAFFMILLTFGMETTFFRFSVQSKDPFKVFSNAFFIVFFISITFLIAIFYNQHHLANILELNKSTDIIYYLAIIIFFDAITSIPLAQLRLDNKALKFSLIRIGNIIVNISLNIFFFLICPNSDSHLIQIVYNPEIGVGYAFISNLVASFFTVILCLPIMFRFRFSINYSLLKEMVKYALPLVFVGLAAMINEVGDKIFLKYLIIPKQEALANVGIYGANYKLAILMTIFIQVFKYAAEPFFFKNSDTKEGKTMYSKVMTWFIIFCLTIFLIVTLYISIFQYFIGEDYRVGLYIVPIILLANMFLGVYYNLSIWYKISNRTIYGAIISLVGVFITVVLNFLLIPVIGYLGSAIATLVCYFSIMVLSYFLGQKYYPVEYDVKRIFLYCLIAGLLFGISNYFEIKSFYINIIVSTILLLSFLASILYIEKIKISKLLKRHYI